MCSKSRLRRRDDMITLVLSTIAVPGFNRAPYYLGAYTGRFFGRRATREKKRARHAMLNDIHHLKKVSEACYDLLRTSIAVDRDRVKTIAPSQSPPSQGVGPVEPGDGPGPQLRIESGERVARPAAGTTGRDPAATLTGMVLSC